MIGRVETEWESLGGTKKRGEEGNCSQDGKQTNNFFKSFKIIYACIEEWIWKDMVGKVNMMKTHYLKLSEK